MSYKDKLDDFDRDWQRHQRWLKTQNANGQSNRYVAKAATSGFAVALEDMPHDVRQRVLLKAEQTIKLLVEWAHAEERREYVTRAVDEARATLRDLGHQQPPPIAPLSPPAPMPIDPSADVARLGAALEGIAEPFDESDYEEDGDD